MKSLILVMFCVFQVALFGQKVTLKYGLFCGCETESDSSNFDFEIENEVRRNILAGGVKNKLLIEAESRKLNFKELMVDSAVVVLMFDEVGSFKSTMFTQSKFRNKAEFPVNKLDELFNSVEHYNLSYYDSSGKRTFVNTIILMLQFDSTGKLVDINPYT